MAGLRMRSPGRAYNKPRRFADIALPRFWVRGATVNCGTVTGTIILCHMERASFGARLCAPQGIL